MQQVKCGVKMDLKKLPPDGPLHHFGIEEVNSLLKNGARIVSIDPPNAIMQRIGEDGDNVNLTIIGFGLTINLEV